MEGRARVRRRRASAAAAAMRSPGAAGRLAVAVALMLACALGPASALGSAPARSPCPALCAHDGGPQILGFAQLGPVGVRLTLALRAGGWFEAVLNRSVGGHLVAARPTLLSSSPREVLAGSFPTGGRPVGITALPIGHLDAGIRDARLRLAPAARALAAGVYVLRVYSLTRAGRIRNRGGAIVLRRLRDGRLLALLAAGDYAPPSAATAAADAITPAGATLAGQVVPAGLPTSYYFQYGTSPAYGAQTPPQSAGAGVAALAVSAGLSGLVSETTYHYRLVASQCGGCAWGTSVGQDMTFTTPPTPQQIAAARALATYQAMQQYFYAANVYPGDTSSLYAEDYPHSGDQYASLWPFSRALVRTITLAGVPSSLLGGASYQAAIEDRLVGLSRYWDTTASGPGYDSTPLAPYGDAGAKYFDDQAWIGLALAQLHQLTGDPATLSQAQSVWSFVYPGGWAGGLSFEPGGIFWTQQGSGPGLDNHDRTTTSSAPNAELALLLAQADPADASAYQAGAAAIYGWLEHYLYNVQGDPADPNPNFDPHQPALMFDKVKGDDAVDETLRTYNQGAMIALDVREYQQTGQAGYLAQAEAIASTALSTFTESFYIAKQPAAFDAIFFRGLLVL